MTFDKKVVSITRSTGYMHRRAMELYDKNDLLGSLDMLRLCARQDPRDTGLKRDIARVLRSMGQLREAGRILLDLNADEPDRPENLLGLAECLCRMGNADASGRVLDSALCLKPELANTDAVYDLENELSARHPFIPDRRKSTILRMRERASGHMLNGSPARAAAELKRSLLSGDSAQARAMYSLCLAEAGDTQEALKEALRAYDEGECDIYIILYRTFTLCGRDDLAREALGRAAGSARSDDEYRAAAFTLFDADDVNTALKMADKFLEIHPCDCSVLHLKAACAYKAGDRDTAARCWRTVRAILPDEPAAAWYLDALENDIPFEAPSSLSLPRSEAQKRLAVIASSFSTDRDALGERWDADGEFRSALKWAASCDSPMIRPMAISLLALIDRPEATSAVRLEMFDPAVPNTDKLRILALSNGRDVLPPDPDAGACLLPPVDRIMDELPAGHRRVLKEADAFLFDVCGISSLPTLAVMWMNIDMRTRLELTRTDTAGAALAKVFLDLRDPSGEDPHEFDVPKRQFDYYYNRIIYSIRNGGRTDAEGH